MLPSYWYVVTTARRPPESVRTASTRETTTRLDEPDRELRALAASGCSIAAESIAPAGSAMRAARFSSTGVSDCALAADAKPLHASARARILREAMLPILRVA
jgi:hypothetical protein